MDTTAWTRREVTSEFEPAASATTPVRRAVDSVRSLTPGPVVLAVSGGRDSMALMFAMARWARPYIAAVATFDHGTGESATQAASLVVAEGRRLGLTVVRERARAMPASEAAWRDARWEFLERVGRAFHAPVATAHTRDDQLETVVLRLLRGTGVRGLAALQAPSPHVRPWLDVSRQDVADWASIERIPFVDDPTNASRRYLRSRVRHDLLPALESCVPRFGEAMLAVAREASAWRQDVEQFLTDVIVPLPADHVVPVSSQGIPMHVLHLKVATFHETTEAGRAVIWPAALARIGVTLDRHGLAALLRFNAVPRTGATLHIAGDARVVIVRRDGEAFYELRAPRQQPVPHRRATDRPRAAQGALHFGAWRLIAAPDVSSSAGTLARRAPAEWACMLPRHGAITVRGCLPGDRIRTAGAPAGRRVAKYLSEARVPSLDRLGWPVVLWESEIVWIPGVCRSVAAPNRPGWSDLIWYRCEREHG